MMNPTKYNKIYFMACALHWYIEHTHTGSYDDDDLYEAMDDIGIPDKKKKKVLQRLEDEYDLGGFH